MRRIAIIGLGYAGLHTALALGKHKKVIGYDINTNRINELKKHIDVHNDFTPDDFTNNHLEFTTDPDQLKWADFYIIIVPTPINQAKEPDFTALILASQLVGKYLKKGDIVVYESTVYPGATEEVCLPILEKVSKLSFGKDFFLGYSPERINPGDQIHRFEDMIKIVSGSNSNTLNIVAEEYSKATDAGIHKVSSIKAAEAAKVIENTQRDVNIAFMNEIATLLKKLDLNTQEVLNAALTKWNFLPFKPGFVGGHCIGVDPYYLIHKAHEAHYFPDLISAARKINEQTPIFIADEAIKFILKHHKLDKNSVIGVLGITYKENCPDIRNSLVVYLINELESYGIKVKVHDPLADPIEVKHEYGIQLVKWNDFSNLAAIVLAVPHSEFKNISADKYAEKLCDNGIIIDIKAALSIEIFKSAGIDIWQF